MHENSAAILLARRLVTPHSAPMNDAITRIVLAVLQRAPEWIRHDLATKDAATRARAEETLAAMIGSAFEQPKGSS